MKRKKYSLIWAAGMLALGALACGLLPVNPPDEPVGPQALYTQAAETIAALFTQEAIQTQMAVIHNPEATATIPILDPTLQPATATVSLPASPTPLPPTATQVPSSATPRPRLCDQARFIKDVTIPDGTVLGPDELFTKIWRLENIGTCTWDGSYDLIYVSGERMEAPRAIPLGETIRPGEVVDLKVAFRAPEKAGSYRSYWMLRNSSAKLFGLGEGAATSFWVDIRVSTNRTGFAYDFSANYCTADWRSGSGSLPCPGNTSAAAGSVLMLDRPTLETGRHEDEPGLWVRPNTTQDGWISGSFPAYKVKTEDHFVAGIGCLYDTAGCKVRFRLDYRNQNGVVKNLGSWLEAYEGQIRVVAVDLSALAGESVSFILTVENEGKVSKANGLWFVPSIRNIKPTPTSAPTHTPTITATQAPTATPTQTQEPTSTATPTETVTPTVTQDLNAISAGSIVQHRLAQDLGLLPEQVAVQSVEASVWQDTCLGVELPGVICAQALIPGYRVNLLAQDKSYQAHTNSDASIIYWFEL